MADSIKKVYLEKSNYLANILQSVTRLEDNSQKYSIPKRIGQPPTDFTQSRYISQGMHQGAERYSVSEYTSKGKTTGLQNYSVEVYTSQGNHDKPKQYIQSNRKIDPFCNHKYEIYIAGKIVGGFSEIGAMEITSEMGEYFEGGQNQYPYHYVKKIKYSNITLKRGLTIDTYLWDWYQDVILGVVNKRDISIQLYQNGNEAGEKKCWNVYSAFPVKWTGSPLNAGKSEIYVESIEFAHQGIFLE